ncbi:unnamed protein product [Hydatigera taeniaeformis]|uniref:F-box domain-containing protein n=1 Tax=Hydatigena taeniaeformis TaxID=6205 RepID=A0A0R3X4R7_HYDTA|nr:unnamed protein product [Hydatigera taeniaeformis]
MANTGRERYMKGDILRIPMEVGVKICKYLNATELMNLYSAIPQWRWILYTPPFAYIVREMMEEWKWIDKHICLLLFSGDAEITHTKAVLATAYHNQQDALHHRLVHTKLPEYAQKPVHCLFLTSRSDTSRLEDNVKEYQCDLQVLKHESPTRIYFDVTNDAIHFFRNWQRSSQASGGSCLQKLTHVAGSGREGEGRRLLTDYDCVIIDADYGDDNGIYSDMDELLLSMTASQTFVTTGSLLYIKGLVSNLDCMKEMLWSLDGMESSPLPQVAANWRIWCNQYQNNFGIDLVEIVRWTCLDIIVRRSGETLHN